ncbi:MAG: hypothetical protein WBM21_03835 [Christensenellales bacterium]
MLKKVTIIIILCLTLFALFSCGFGDSQEPDENGSTVEEEMILNIDDLNYNSRYFNPQNKSEKGFILYDTIDLSKIKAEKDLSDITVDYEFILDGETINTIRKQYYDAFPVYSFRKTGEYTIKITAHPRGGTPWIGKFKVNVLAGGYADKAELAITDLTGNPVEEAVPGQQYKLIAKVYSDGVLQSQDTDKFYSFWIGDERGIRESVVTIENQRTDTELHFSFICINIADINYKFDTTLTIKVKNNYSGLQTSFGGLYVSNGQTSINVVQIVDNFMNQISVSHVFTNGDKTALTINTFDIYNKEGQVAAFIKYDGEEEFHRYQRNMFNFTSGYPFSYYYIPNGTVYQLNPQKNSAEFYLAIFEKRGDDTNPKYYPIEDSFLDIELRKTGPNGIDVLSIGFSEKDMTSDTKFIVSSREVVENQVDVKVRVTNNVYQADLNKQYFTLDVELLGDIIWMKDYVYEISDLSIISYSPGLKRFIPQKKGECVIVIKSAFLDIRYELTVNVINPIKYYTIDTTGPGSYEYPQVFIGELDFSPYIRVRKHYYNNTSKTRGLNQNESLRFKHRYIGSDFVEAHEIPKSDRMYSFMTINLYEYDQPKENVNYNMSDNQISVFLLPDIEFEIDQTVYRLSEFQTLDYNNNSNNDKNKVRYYTASFTLEVDEYKELNILRVDGEDYDEEKQYNFSMYYSSRTKNWIIDYQGLYRESITGKKETFDTIRLLIFTLNISDI